MRLAFLSTATSGALGLTGNQLTKGAWLLGSSPTFNVRKISFSTNQSIKVEKGNQSISGGNISESIFSTETITLHRKIISSKLLENLFDIGQSYQYSIFQLNHQ